MSITRDQLRAARVLLHLQQKQLAALSEVSLSTIRRFEGGLDIGPLHKKALRRSLWKAGAIFIDEDGSRHEDEEDDYSVPPGAVGVVLKPGSKLPAATRTRIAADGHQAGEDAAVAGSAERPGNDAQHEPPPLEDADDPTTARSDADAPITVEAGGSGGAPASKGTGRKPRRGWPAPV